MNAAHQIGRKINRYKRLVRRIKEVPADSAKVDRKNSLLYELGKLGIRDI